VNSELTFTAISYGVIGLLLLTALVLSLISMWKESRSNVPIKSLIAFTLVVIILSAFLSLCMTYVKSRYEKGITPHVKTEIVQLDALPQ
jgi:membrane-bound ClpP family serine protease